MLEDLKEWLLARDHEYYVLNESTVSDLEYDAKLALAIANGIVLPKVAGKASSKFKSVKLKYPMLSLGKVISIDELNIWLSKILKDYPNALFSIEWKFDGLSANLIYEKGKLVTISTRGDGLVGEDVTYNQSLIKDLPSAISVEKDYAEVRGEVIMTKKELLRISLENEKALSNCRNGASGTLRRLPDEKNERRELEFRAYDTRDLGEINLEALTTYGFTHGLVYDSLSDYKLINQYVKELELKRNDLDFEADGLVIKVIQLELREALGFTNHCPKWAIAYKFKPTMKTTGITDVEWNVGKFGTITPVAILEPVDIGVIITRVTMHNLREFSRLSPGKLDDVTLIRAGDVIPKILDIAHTGDPSAKFHAPVYCPSCNSETIAKEVELVCGDIANCRGVGIRRIIHLCSRAAFDIDGVGEAVAEKFFDHPDYRNLSDFFNPVVYKEVANEGLIKEIESKLEISLQKFIYSQCIETVGRDASKILSKRYLTLEALKLATLEEVLSLDGIGPTIATNFIEYFSNPVTLDILDGFLKYSVKIIEVVNKSSSLKDTCWVVTGGFVGYTRDELHALIETNGGAVSKSVGGKVTHVLVGTDAGSKLKDAQTKKKLIVNIDDLLKMI